MTDGEAVARTSARSAKAFDEERIPKAYERLKELAWNVTRLWRGFGPLGPIGPVDGPAVLVIPGFLANDRTTLPLRRALAEAGWRVHGWDNGWNTGVQHDTLDRVGARLDAIGHNEPVLIVGWSLGGLFAREFARHFPDRVRAVITLGSPFSGDPRLNNVWPLYERVAGHRVDNPPVPRITEKPPVPHLAIWSRKDGLIAPRAARGLEHERDEEVEVPVAHMAFGVSRKAARRVVQEIDRFLEKYE